jgi:hypothetical protein
MISRPIEYNYQAAVRNQKLNLNNFINVETFLNSKRKPSQNSLNLFMLDQPEGCQTPKNQSFLINFNGCFDEHHRNNLVAVDEIWEKLKSNFWLILDDDEYVFNWFKQ